MSPALSAALDWARRSPIVKALDRTDVLAAAPDLSIRVFRHFFPTQDMADVEGAYNAILGALKGYRHPKLYVETYNEVPKESLQKYLTFLTLLVPRLHQAGLKVCGPSWASGDFEQADWDWFQTAGWCGMDLVSLHAYWGNQHFTKWHALRYRTYWKSGDPPIVITECGRDRVEGGKGGWQKDNLTAEQYAKELIAYDAELAKDSYVLGATPFTSGPTSQWAPFDMDSISPLLPKGGQPTLPTDFTSPNHDGPRASTVGIVLHATLGDSATAQTEFDGTVSWFNSPLSQVSAHAVIGPGGVIWRPIHTDVIGWHCRASNAHWLGVEMCKARVGDPIDPTILDAAAKLVAGWCHDYEIPLVWSTTAGLAEHREMPTNTDGHKDVGGPFDRNDFLNRVKHYSGGSDLTDAQKKAVLDDLDILWGYTKADTIKKNPAESEHACHERIIALKETLGLNR